MGKIKDFPVKRLPARPEGRASVVNSFAKTEDEPFKGLNWLSTYSACPAGSEATIAGISAYHEESDAVH